MNSVNGELHRFMTEYGECFTNLKTKGKYNNQINLRQ